MIFLFSKLALVTCGFYLGIALLLDAAFFAVAMLKDSFGIFMTRSAWFLTFGIFWFISFALAWRIVMVPLFDKIQR